MEAYELALEAARVEAAAATADWARRTQDQLALQLAEAASGPGRPLVELLAGIAQRFLEGAAVEDLGASEEHRLLRRTVRDFAQRVIRPRAQEIHRRDLDLPEEIIEGAARLGLFGLSVPEAYSGSAAEAGDVMPMLIATEELSRASLCAGGSLITRPEILVRALLSGGTEAQRTAWLPAIASGRQMVAVAVTEPDFGSDVASIECRAERAGAGWRLNGAKLWCTFAGRAELLMILCRTAPGGHRGLSLFVAEKPAFAGHEFEHRQPRGGRLRGRAIPTIGYRGMHSFELLFEDYLLPADALVGGEQGLNRGFYLQMEGFAPGRLQTAGRAVGLMQAAFEDALAYARERRVFGRAVAAHQLPQAALARMAVAISSARQLTYAAAETVRAALAKLYAARAAEQVTRDAMQLFGGLGYAEETDVSRYFVDARVLSIFEGAEEVLALRVIARSLLEGRDDAV